jgi:hypothetical protein
MNYLLADTITGVWEVETLVGEDCLILNQEDFYDALRTLKDGEVIGAQVDCERYSKIDSEYGVQFLQ